MINNKTCTLLLLLLKKCHTNKTKSITTHHQARVEAKLSGKRVDDVMNRLTVALPTPRGDGRDRGPSIPPSVLAAKAKQAAAARGAFLRSCVDVCVCVLMC